MNFHEPTTPRERVALGLIASAAAAGEPCPTNETLAEAVGCLNGKAGREVVAKLEARGLIAVERSGKSRVVTVISTGATTARLFGSDQEDMAHRRELLAEMVAEGRSVASAGAALGMKATRAHQVFAQIAAETDLLNLRPEGRQRVACN